MLYYMLIYEYIYVYVIQLYIYINYTYSVLYTYVPILHIIYHAFSDCQMLQTTITSTSTAVIITEGPHSPYTSTKAAYTIVPIHP